MSRPYEGYSMATPTMTALQSIMTTQTPTIGPPTSAS